MPGLPFDNLRRTCAVALRCMIAAAALTGCGSADVTMDPVPVEVPATFTFDGTVPAADAWWTELGDPGLDAAIDAALTANLDLLAARARVAAARAVIERASSERRPTLAATAGVEARTPARDGGPVATTLGVQAGYEVDLWGRVGATVDAERLRTEATRADYEAAASSVAADVAALWVQLGAIAEDTALVDAQADLQRSLLEGIERRFALGAVPAADVLRQRERLEATLDERRALDADAAVLRHALAELLAVPPAEASTGPRALPDIPAVPATGVPGEVLADRPDVHGAWLRLQAADRDTASALADRYPRLDLSASLTTGPEPDRLFRDWTAAIAGDLFAPILQGGRIRAEIARSEALEDVRLFEYAATLLAALREVEDAFVRESRAAERIDAIDARLGHLRDAWERLRVAYAGGEGDYLELVSALDGVQDLQRQHVAARRDRVLHRIELYRALSGPVLPEGAADPPPAADGDAPASSNDAPEAP